VFENRVLRSIFGPKRDEVTGNGENYIMRSWIVCTPYPISCGDKIEKIEMCGPCSTFGGRERCVQRFAAETWRKEVPGGRRRRCEDNITMNPQEVGGGCEDCIGLAEDRNGWRALVIAVRNLQVP
jgi:hypothetical protein